MRKIISVVLSILVLFSLTACSDVKPGEFTATEEYINQRLDKAGLQAFIDTLDKTDGGTLETEVNFISSLKDKNVPEKTIGLISLDYNSGFCDRLAISSALQRKGWENTQKFISFACDLYGVNSKTVIDMVKENFESETDIKYGILSSVGTEFFENGFHYEFTFLPENEGDYKLENLNMVTVIITEENRFNTDKQQSEQARLKNIADNPLLYTDGEPDYPQWKTEDEINSVMSAEYLPFVVEFDYFSKTDIGTANTAYTLNDSTGEQVGSVSTVQFASGIEISLMQYISGANDIPIKIDTENLLRIACELSDVEYSPLLLNTVKDYIPGNDFNAYFEYGGLYWRGDFSSYYDENIKSHRYLHSITVYESDVLKGRLTSWINYAKQNGQDYKADQEVYDKFFG